MIAVLRRAALASLLVAVGPSASAAQPGALELAREAELQRLSVCPSVPTVGVLGGAAAGLFVTTLVERAGAAVAVVERARLDAITDELCLGPAFDPSTTVPAGGLLFAKFLVDVTADLGAPSAPVSVRAIRVDSGEVVFERATTLAPATLDALEAFVRGASDDLLPAVAAGDYACANTFAAVIAEDVTLGCAGTIPQTGTAYTVEAAFTTEFTMPGFDYTTRGTPQTLTGTVRVLPGTARTTLADRVTRDSPRCAFTLESARDIRMTLASTAVPATVTVTVPANTAAPWTVVPTVSQVPPLFKGPAVLTTAMTTTASGPSCASPGGTTTQTTKYTHQELNTFTFGPRQVLPVCGQGHLVPAAFVRVPGLGTPGAADIAAGCTTRSSRARFSFRRTF
ncbi:MAG: hypothetical protein AB1635_13325 [Acidobacteriota bacterium]